MTFGVIIAATFISAFASVLLLFALSRLAARLGMVDQPDWRKIQKRPTPLVGGPAIGLAVTVALFLIMPFVDGGVGRLSAYTGLAQGGVLIVLLGMLDDIKSIPARYKLAGQFLACCAAIFIDGNLVGNFGMRLFGEQVTLGPVIVPFTVLVMLCVINGVNMIDGIDGLAGGLAFIALALMCKAAFAGRSELSALILLVFLGALAVFLLVNFPFFGSSSAKVYLGDSGALLLGFVVVYFAIRLSALPGRVFRPSTALWFLFLPVADAMLLYVRRTIRDRAPFAAGRDHIHHLLMGRVGPRWTTWILVLSSAVLAALSYAGERLRVSPMAHTVLWLVAFLLYAVLTHRPWRDAWTRSREAEGVGVSPKPRPSAASVREPARGQTAPTVSGNVAGPT